MLCSKNATITAHLSANLIALITRVNPSCFGVRVMLCNATITVHLNANLLAPATVTGEEAVELNWQQAPTPL